MCIHTIVKGGILKACTVASLSRSEICGQPGPPLYYIQCYTTYYHLSWNNVVPPGSEDVPSHEVIVIMLI